MQGQHAFEYASTGAKCSTTGAGAAVTARAGVMQSTTGAVASITAELV